jgi:hypothetical protein
MRDGIYGSGGLDHGYRRRSSQRIAGLFGSIEAFQSRLDY